MSRSRFAAGLAALALLLLAAPFAGLVLATDWRHFGFAHGDGAAAVGVVMLVLSFLLLLAIRDRKSVV